MLHVVLSGRCYVCSHEILDWLCAIKTLHYLIFFFVLFSCEGSRTNKKPWWPQEERGASRVSFQNRDFFFFETSGKCSVYNLEGWKKMWKAGGSCLKGLPIKLTSRRFGGCQGELTIDQLVPLVTVRYCSYCYLQYTVSFVRKMELNWISIKFCDGVASPCFSSHLWGLLEQH